MIVILAILADLILGTPENFPDSLDLINFILEKEKNLIRKTLKTKTQIRVAGIIFTFINTLAGYFVLKLLIGFFDFNKALQFVVKVHLAYMLLSSGVLKRQALMIKSEMKKSTKRGRAMLSSFVERDTDKLSNSGIIKASIEDISKKSCEEVFAPILFLIFGVQFAYVYVVISLMDKNWYQDKEFCKDFGFFASKLNDILNIIPARLTSLILLLGGLVRFNTKRALKVTLRDHKNQDKPNIGWPQSTMAGLLGVQLGGGAFYDGIYIEKPYIGDDTRAVRAKDIDDSIKIIRRSMLSFLLVYSIGLLIYTLVR